jgi:hypothetical protein
VASEKRGLDNFPPLLYNSDNPVAGNAEPGLETQKRGFYGTNDRTFCFLPARSSRKIRSPPPLLFTDFLVLFTYSFPLAVLFSFKRTLFIPLLLLSRRAIAAVFRLYTGGLPVQFLFRRPYGSLLHSRLAFRRALVLAFKRTLARRSGGRWWTVRRLCGQ